MAEALAADDEGGFHEGAGEVAQEDPVNGVVDVGFEAGAVEVDVFEVGGCGEAEVEAFVLVSVGEEVNESAVDVLESFFGEPVGEAVAGAFGVGFDSVDALNADEPAQQVAVGEEFAELTMRKVFDEAGDVATQCHVTAEAEALDLGRGHLLEFDLFLLEGEFDEVLFEV